MSEAAVTDAVYAAAAAVHSFAVAVAEVCAAAPAERFAICPAAARACVLCLAQAVLLLRVRISAVLQPVLSVRHSAQCAAAV